MHHRDSTLGPLTQLTTERPQIINEVIARCEAEVDRGSLDSILLDALYLERHRLRRARDNAFTRSRTQADEKLWNEIHNGLLKSSAEVDRRLLYHRVLGHFTEEITGNFDPSVYRFAISILPFAFSMLLNAASLKKTMPSHLQASLAARVKLTGEVERFRKLANQGTILLVPTHQSNIDSLVVGYSILRAGLGPFSYGAGLNLFSNPVLGYFMSRLGAYTVDRQKQSAIYKHVLKNYSLMTLKRGIHSVFFPGGGRVRSGAVESRLKLGLLGTAIDAQLENLKEGREKPNVYIVPMVTSYHFVLEASSLIEDYLAEAGRSRYLSIDSETPPFVKVMRFFWKIFKTESEFIVRIGSPLDVFGNLVDDEGRAIGPNGSSVDARRWLTTGGELKHDRDRDAEYTRELGDKIVERYHRENTVLTSHLVAFSYFETLRRKYPDADLFKLLRLSYAQRTLSFDEFMLAVERDHARLQELSDGGYVVLSDMLKTSNVRAFVEDGVKQLGVLHGASVIQFDAGTVSTEDMNLVYYYRNRLSGYGLSMLADPQVDLLNPGRLDENGFLA